MSSLLVVCGPPGVGKTTVVEQISDKYYARRIISRTTRPPRSGEKNGRDYWFESEGNFDQQLQSRSLIFTSWLYGYRYGVDRLAIDQSWWSGLNPCLELSAPSLTNLLAVHKDTEAIFLRPDPVELVVERMRRRGDNEVAIEQRRISGLSEIKYYQNNQHLFLGEVVVRGDNLTEVVTEVARLARLREKMSLERE